MNQDSSDSQSVTALQQALDACNLEDTKVSIDAGVSADTKNSSYDYSALHLAAREADTEMIKYLLSKGANINAKRKTSGRTPLKAAAMSNDNEDDSHFETIKLLLENGTDIDFGEPLSSVLDSIDIVKLFLKYKVQPTESVMIHAVDSEGGKGSVEVVELLLNNGFDAKSLGTDGHSIMLSAVESGNLEIIQLLINHGYQCKSTLLHKVAGCNKGLSHYKVAEMLLKMGLNINAKDDDNLDTPIHTLAFNIESNLELMKLFLSYKPDLSLQNHRGNTPLVKAIYRENLDIVKLLVDSGADVNGVNLKNGQTPLHTVSVKDGELKIVKWLLFNGANINAVDHNGYGPLVSILCHDRCENIPARFLKFFLEYSDLNVANEKGVNVLEFDSLFEQNHQDCECKLMIIEHLAKLKALDLPVHPSILKSIKNQTKLSDHFEECIEELALAKKTKLCNSWITFFNLIVDNNRKLKNYAGNEDLVEDHKKSDWLKIFPIYGDEMQENMKKGIERRKLFDKSTLILSDLLPSFSPTHLVIQNLFDCVSTKELKKFCE